MRNIIWSKKYLLQYLNSKTEKEKRLAIIAQEKYNFTHWARLYSSPINSDIGYDAETGSTF